MSAQQQRPAWVIDLMILGSIFALVVIASFAFLLMQALSGDMTPVPHSPPLQSPPAYALPLNR